MRYIGFTRLAIFMTYLFNILGISYNPGNSFLLVTLLLFGIYFLMFELVFLRGLNPMVWLRDKWSILTMI